MGYTRCLTSPCVKPDVSHHPVLIICQSPPCVTPDVSYHMVLCQMSSTTHCYTRCLPLLTVTPDIFHYSVVHQRSHGSKGYTSCLTSPCVRPDVSHHQVLNQLFRTSLLSGLSCGRGWGLGKGIMLKLYSDVSHCHMLHQMAHTYLPLVHQIPHTNLCYSRCLTPQSVYKVNVQS